MRFRIVSLATLMVLAAGVAAGVVTTDSAPGSFEWGAPAPHAVGSSQPDSPAAS